MPDQQASASNKNQLQSSTAYKTKPEPNILEFKGFIGLTDTDRQINQPTDRERDIQWPSLHFCEVKLEKKVKYLFCCLCIRMGSLQCKL